MAETPKPTHKCIFCNSFLESKEALQEHFRKHANKEIDRKEAGSKSKTSRIIYKKENMISEKNKDWAVSCDVCGQEFTSNTKAIQHKFRKHPDDTNKYLCPYCGMQFTLKPLYTTHLNTHSSDVREKKSLFCEECEAEFYFEEAKTYHIKASHKRVKTLFEPVPTPPPSKKIKINNAGEMQSVYYCHLCGCEYILKFNLQEHLKRNHSEAERLKMPADLIRCTICEALFYNTKAYENHNLSHKPDDLYVISEQQRLQTVSRVDQDFDIRRVQFITNTYTTNNKNLRKNRKLKLKKKKEEEEDEELSPPSTPDSSDSSDMEIFLKFNKKPNDTKENSLIENEKKPNDTKENSLIENEKKPNDAKENSFIENEKKPNDKKENSLIENEKKCNDTEDSKIASAEVKE